MSIINLLTQKILVRKFLKNKKKISVWPTDSTNFFTKFDRLNSLLIFWEN